MSETSKLRKVLGLSVIAAMTLVWTGCDHAYVGCGNVAKLLVNMGLINTEGVVLGNLIELDPVAHVASYASELKDYDKEKDSDTKPDSDEADMDTSSGLDISFSMKLTPAEQATLSSQLSHSVQLKLTNSNRHQIKLPNEVINRPPNKTVIASYMHPGHHLVFVVAGNTSESAQFTTKNSADNKLSLTLPGGKNFNVDVNYQCQGALTETVSKDRAKDALTFFKVVEIIQNTDGSYTTQTFTEALNAYDLSNAAPKH
jgi:hypothetical protein